MDKLIPTMTGYKATDANMVCSGNGYSHQYELGKWYEHTGPLELCKQGFHFCSQPSGPHNYHTKAGTRIFKVEAEGILDLPVTPGTEHKLVARRIRLVEEIIATGHRNTGDRNTGHRNTGDRNTGDSNTGYSNTGNRNTGDRNTGDSNTGYSNTGDRNTGDSNTGYRNTGHRNTGSSNTGDSNTGYSNTGDRNTGIANATNNCNGLFCVVEPTIKSFDIQTKLTRNQFTNKYLEYYELSQQLMQDEPIDIKPYANIPGITKKKLAILHKKHMDGRKAAANK